MSTQIAERLQDIFRAVFNIPETADVTNVRQVNQRNWDSLAHAARTIYGRPVLHGAFSAGLISRLAGMHLPGADCLLHSMRLRFVAPILPPATLVVSGRLTSEGAGTGRVDATVADATTGASYVDATYEFSRHRMTE